MKRVSKAAFKKNLHKLLHIAKEAKDYKENKMPYIKPKDREKFNGVLNNIRNIIKEENINAGELNYLLSSIVGEFAYNQGQPCYQKYNDALGALEGVKLELYRKQIATYEDKKVEENGELYVY